MSCRRRVSLNIAISLSERDTLDLRLPGILSPGRMREIMSHHLVADGWKTDGDQITRKSDNGRQVYSPSESRVTVVVEKAVNKKVEVTIEGGWGDERSTKEMIIEEEKTVIANELEGEVEKTRKEFIGKYIPATIADAVVEKARTLDPSAVVNRNETADGMVITIDLEVSQ